MCVYVGKEKKRWEMWLCYQKQCLKNDGKCGPKLCVRDKVKRLLSQWSPLKAKWKEEMDFPNCVHMHSNFFRFLQYLWFLMEHSDWGGSEREKLFWASSPNGRPVYAFILLFHSFSSNPHTFPTHILTHSLELNSCFLTISGHLNISIDG
jgi:hypothetical protein